MSFNRFMLVLCLCCTAHYKIEVFVYDLQVDCSYSYRIYLQCFDAVGWAAACRKGIWPVKTER